MESPMPLLPLLAVALLAGSLVTPIAAAAGHSGLSKQEQKALDSLSNGIELFSWNLILRTALDLPAGENVVLSPFSVWTMLSVLSEGAQGQTLGELETVLRHPADFEKVVRDGFKAIRRSLAQMDHVEYVDLNTIYLDDQVGIRKEYQSLVNNVYFTRAFPVDFEKSTTLKFMNDYFKTNTDGYIKNVVTQEDLKDSKMILINGVFFQGKWAMPFAKSLTKPEPFFDEKKLTIGKVNMMSTSGFFYNVKSKLLKSRIVEIPYGVEDKISMLLIIPNEGVKLNEVYTMFTKFKIRDLFSEYLSENALVRENVQLKMPRMQVTSDLVLNMVLNNMGIFDIFDPSYSDMSTMASTPLHLSRVIHQTTIRIMEDGVNRTETHQPDETIIANRPFIYLVIEKQCKFIVLGGIYREPKIF